MQLSLRPFQKSALDSLAHSGAHVLCIAPTGSGKTLIVSRFLERHPELRAVLLSPLIALSRQHKETLSQFKTQLRILSPESITRIEIQRDLKQWSPSFWTIDECHCLWDWGETFRPAFREIPKHIHNLSQPKFRSLWLTASCPPAGLEYLRTNLPHPLKEIGEFNLPSLLNIEIRKTPWETRSVACINWIREQKEGGIVFCQTRRSAERVYHLLKSKVTSPILYHAGLSKEERRSAEKVAAAQENATLIATAAFGMGMHLPHLKWTCLWSAPNSLLALVQAIGRVGRTQQATALILWDLEDFQLLEWLAKQSKRGEQDLLDVYAFLSSNFSSHEDAKAWLCNYFNKLNKLHRAFSL